MRFCLKVKSCQTCVDTYIEVVGQCTGLDDNLVENRVVVVAKQDVVPHRSVLDPWLLCRQAEAGLSLGNKDDAVQPAKSKKRRGGGEG